MYMHYQVYRYRVGSAGIGAPCSSFALSKPPSTMSSPGTRNKHTATGTFACWERLLDCMQEPRLLIGNLWLATNVLVLAFAFVAIVFVAKNHRCHNPDGVCSRAHGFAVFWTFLVCAGVGIAGTRLLRSNRHKDAVHIGCFAGLTSLLSFDFISLSVVLSGLTGRAKAAHVNGGGDEALDADIAAAVTCALLAALYGAFALALFRYRHDIIRDDAALRHERYQQADAERREEAAGVALGEFEGRVVERKGLFYADT